LRHAAAATLSRLRVFIRFRRCRFDYAFVAEPLPFRYIVDYFATDVFEPFSLMIFSPYADERLAADFRFRRHCRH